VPGRPEPGRGRLTAGRGAPTTRAGAEEEFRDLTAGADTPMYVVTAATAGARAGCLVGFATQASIEPPRLMVLLSKANRTYRLARRTSWLAVHYLHEANHELAALFGGETGDEVDKFTRCSWRPGPGGIPLLDGTRGWVLGAVVRRADVGDHVAHLLDVVEAETDRGGAPLSSRGVRTLTAGHPA
jgi:flavin reductase (DIM6/NTAB) family NADH-FMN oxidoreductase RutF